MLLIFFNCRVYFRMNDAIKKIYRSLLSDISAGKIQPGDILPKEIELAAKFKTNRMNAQRAMNALAEHNIVTRKKRMGTMVNPHLDHEKLQKLLKETNRNIYVLYSMTPHWIHWNESSFSALEEAVAPEGFSVNYRNIPTGSGRSEYKNLLTEISNAGASALVIFPDSEDADFLNNNADLLLDFQMPIYMLNRSGAPMSIDMASFLSADPFGDGIYVGSLLRKNNYHNILIIYNVAAKEFWGDKRCEGIEMSIMHNHDQPTPLVRHVQNFDRAVEIIKQERGKITVVALNNEFAAKLIDKCVLAELRIPDDYQLIAFDDNPLYRSYNLTSLGFPMEEVGKVFGRMICDKSLLQDYRGKVSVKLNSKLIKRETLKLNITT